MSIIRVLPERPMPVQGAINRCAKAAYEFVLDQWLGKVTRHSEPQHFPAVGVVRIGRNEDRGNDWPFRDQISVELGARHRWHLDIGHETRSQLALSRYQKFGGGSEHCHGVTERTNQSSHRVAEGFVIVDDRNQRMLWQSSPGRVLWRPHRVMYGRGCPPDRPRMTRWQLENPKPWFRPALL